MSQRIDRRTLLRTSAGAATVAAGLTAAGPGLEQASAATPAKPRVPGTTTAANGTRRSAGYLGLFQATSTPGISQPEFLEGQVGRRMAINHCFRQPPEAPWGPLKERMLRDKRAGRIPMLSYAAGERSGIADHQDAADARLGDIAAGRRDAWIDGQARALRDLRTPVFFRFTWEFDRRYLGEEGARTHRIAWRRVRDRFQRVGATNVAFVWCPSWLAFQDGTAARFYPGDGYVDWIGADGYARQPSYTSFANLFSKPHAFAVQHRKPFMVCETGVSRHPLEGGVTWGRTQQSAWIDGLRANLSANAFPNLKALLYFHVDGDNSPLPNQWRLTQPEGGPALASLKSLVWHPRLQSDR